MERKEIISTKNTRIKKLFRQNSKKEAIKQFKQYLQNYRTIPVVLKDFIRKHIIIHFHRYVEHLDNENNEKTSTKSKITTDKPTLKNKEIIYSGHFFLRIL